MGRAGDNGGISLEEELKSCPLCNFGVQTVMHSKGFSLVLTMHDQDGEMLAHSIYDKAGDVKQMITVLKRFIDHKQGKSNGTNPH